ncbi:MAG: insulinase family protein [Proteobacteria bacterium]|nr:insulinase family protein [Pseudomonadota bacterium]
MKILGFALLSSFLFVPLAEAELSEKVFEKVLPNGLKVLLLENDRAPVISFQVWYRVGSRNEEVGRTGLSHLLEHMMFKGTKKVGPKDFSRIVQENGGRSNAFTSYDYTAYVETLTADRIQVALDLESDRMQNLVLREDSFQTERKVVIEERRLRTEDNPKAYLMEQLLATAFQRQPYRWPIVGWMQDLERLRLDDVRSYYRTYYNPGNAFVVAVGDFKKEDLILRIEKAFGPIPKEDPPNQDRNIDPLQSGERTIIVKREAMLPFIINAFHVPNFDEPDSFVLEVIATLLSRGRGSRLYGSLVREKRLALHTEADHSLLSRDPGLFVISVELLPGQKIDHVEDAVDQELERLRREPVGDEELAKAKTQLEAAFTFGQDSLFYQGMLLAQYEIAGNWRQIDDYLPAIQRITSKDIQRVANRYLVRDNRTVGILIPLPLREGGRPPEEFSIKEKMVNYR